ncbi:recombinase family protein [Desulfosporosinus metallidurans]|uniref:Recombinase n=1 Tax=Desulfosporosinus metallidurans TaxID=1888891 RepID=A0A1Q8QFQ4_9FIRM|nr:recombinase family protein [Desulfosporosinus metallidurans]OLN26183.1 Recombinase [Desulfosporosinus metallidurans]
MAQRHMPIGYKMIDGVITIKDDKAELVRKAFDYYASGISMLQIAKEFTDMGALNANGKPLWNHGSIGKILNNVKYIGDEFYPAIITGELFEKAEKRREEQCLLLNRNTNYFANALTSKYPFSGKVVCGECGAIFKRYTEHHNANKKANWKCKNYIVDNRVSCRSGVIDDKQLEATFIGIINKVIKNPNLVKPSSKLAELTQNEKVDKVSQQIVDGFSSSKINYEKMVQLIFERSSKIYQSAKLNDFEYQTKKLLSVLQNSKPVTEFGEELFVKTIKSITVYVSGQLRFELINGIQIDAGYPLRTGRRNPYAKDKENSVNNPAQSGI